jgi:hypothetical protein
MQIGRRAALKLFALVGVGLSGIGALWRKLAFAQLPDLELRKKGAGVGAGGTAGLPLRWFGRC